MSDIATTGSGSSHNDSPLTKPSTIDREIANTYVTLEGYRQDFESHEQIALGHGFSDSKESIEHHTKQMRRQLKNIDKRLMK